MMMDGRVEKWLLNLGWTGRSRLSPSCAAALGVRSLGAPQMRSVVAAVILHIVLEKLKKCHSTG